MRDQTIAGGEGEVPLRVSIGHASLDAPPAAAGDGAKKLDRAHFVAEAEKIFQRALSALEEAQKSGNTVRGA